MSKKLFRRTGYTLLTAATLYLGASAYLVNMDEPGFKPGPMPQMSAADFSDSGFELVFGFDLYAHVDQTYLMVNIIFSVALIVPTVWFVSKLNSRNIKSGWVRRVARELGGRQLVVAAELLGEIDEFEKD